MPDEYQIGRASGDVSLAQVGGVLLGEWRKMLAFALVATSLVVGFRVSMGRRYEARVVLSPVVSNRNIGGTGGLAASLLNGVPTGMQATPAMVARMVNLDIVSYRVGLTSIPGAGNERIIDRLLGKRETAGDNQTIHGAVSSVTSVGIDRETGTLTLSVMHKDSALARLIVERTIQEVTIAFRNAARAQASELRAAQEVRLDSAASQLHHAEERLMSFLAANRVLAPYSEAYIQRQRLDRDVQLAQTVYTQVVTEREAAIGRELEETPAVAVVDPIPSRLPRARRHLAVVAFLTFLISMMAYVALTAAREVLARKSATDPQAERLYAVLRRILGSKQKAA